MDNRPLHPRKCRHWMAKARHPLLCTVAPQLAMESPSAQARGVGTGERIMNKRQAQLQQLFEELLLDNIDDLLKESRSTLNSTSDSVKDFASNFDRDHLEAFGADAIEAIDREKLEKWIRDSIHSI